ncbi:hypothetical protein HIV01_016500 [Lysobacter arenosi]|uniref:Outer membrane protein beta-barrel domain-containing protein n=1 Tax=Lysobacter arenosi TaxID=2795387 RepID=A0ABX7RCQ0_9GAMM|nr:hypothetical protein [Lysobacter arenosi]QSX74742.1 hypothetical protein HIV01_016500 [Lysobacter arenosi]
MKKTLMALALVAIAAPIASQASEANGIGYNYAQLDYVYSDSDAFDMDGGTLSGSYAFTDNFFTFGEYGKVKGDHDVSDFVFEGGFDGMKADVKDSHWSLGAGFNASIGDRADWVTKVAYDRHTVKASGYGMRIREHIDGGYITTGVMGRVTDKLTANAYLGYTDYNRGYEGNAFADFGAVYAFNPTWGLHVGAVLSDATETYSLGVRASF